MKIKQNITLKDLTTMRLGGIANFVIEVTSEDEVRQAHQFALDKKLPFFVIGAGSNLIAKDTGYPGVLIKISILGVEIMEETTNSLTVTIGAGETWDDITKQFSEQGWSGIEAMSGIPGTAGATVIQNVGAYGQEIVNTLQTVRVYDTKIQEFTTLTAKDCKLSYRHSIFRGEATGRYIVTQITLKLTHTQLQPPLYNSLQKYFDNQQSSDYSPSAIRKAVLAVRASKLPDPKKLPNSGSFFKNALINKDQADQLRVIDEQAPIFVADNQLFKVPSGYLIEKAGLKNKSLFGFKVHDQNAVVLVNESADSYHDLIKARQTIIQTVADKFQITLEQEPLEIG